MGGLVGGLALGAAGTLFWAFTRAVGEASVGIPIGLIAVAVSVTAFPSLRWLLPRKSHLLSESFYYSASRASATFRWGVQLGAGVRTKLVTPAIYAFVAITWLQPRWWMPLALGAFYGMFRTGAIVILAVVRSERSATGFTYDLPGTTERWTRAPLLLSVGVAAAVALMQR